MRELHFSAPRPVAGTGSSPATFKRSDTLWRSASAYNAPPVMSRWRRTGRTWWNERRRTLAAVEGPAVEKGTQHPLVAVRAAEDTMLAPWPAGVKEHTQSKSGVCDFLPSVPAHRQGGQTRTCSEFVLGFFLPPSELGPPPPITGRTGSQIKTSSSRRLARKDQLGLAHPMALASSRPAVSGLEQVQRWHGRAMHPTVLPRRMWRHVTSGHLPSVNQTPAAIRPSNRLTSGPGIPRHRE